MLPACRVFLSPDVTIPSLHVPWPPREAGDVANFGSTSLVSMADFQLASHSHFAPAQYALAHAAAATIIQTRLLVLRYALFEAMTDVEESSSDTQTAKEAEAAREAALKKAQAGGQTTYKSIIFNLYPSPSFLHYHTVYTGSN